MKNEPLVSIVIPSYNHKKFIGDCINSVIQQSYENIELIIIDDGSEDGSLIEIEKYIEVCSKRFVRFEFIKRENKGLARTLNESLGWCKGKYYAAVASDDIILKNKVKNQVSFMEKNNDTVAVFGNVISIDEAGKEIETKKDKSRFYSFRDIILHNHYLPASTQMMRTNTLKEVGGYYPDILIEDWYMWLKISEHGNIYFMEDIFSMYRYHENNTSKKVKLMHESRFFILDLYKGYEMYNEAKKNIYLVGLCERRNKAKKIKFLLSIFGSDYQLAVDITLMKAKKIIRRLI